MSVIKEKPVAYSPFSSTAAYNPVLKGAITLVLPNLVGAITCTALPVAGAQSHTPLPEWVGFSTTYPSDREHES